MVYIVEAKNFQNPGTAVPLGNQGENKVRGVVFDITDFVEELGADGVVKVKVQRPGEALPYDAELVDEYDEGDVERYKILWTLTDTDTGVTGKGRCQLTYTVDDPESQSDPIVKTIVVSTEVLPSLGVSAPSPNPSSDIVARINEAVVEAEGARDAAVDAKNAAESAEEDATSAKSAAVEAKNTAESKASDSEAYAVGTRGGEPVESADPAYHHNSKYYADYVDETIDEFARVDGYYDQMTVGDAENLVSTVYVTDSDPYIRRTAGGSADISNRKYEELVGGSVSWNQLCSVRSGSYTCSEDTSSYSFTIGTGSQVDIVQNHVYFMSANVQRTISGNNGIGVIFPKLGMDLQIIVNNGSPNGYHAAVVKTAGSVVENKLFVNNYNFKRSFNAGDTVSVDDMVFIDLTLMFGSAIADYIYQLEQNTAGAGVAFFKKLFPKSYYPYNAGEIISVKTSGVKTVGFNQWDEDWEQGRYDDSGTKVASTTAIRSKNFIKVFPSTTYYFESSEENLGRLCFYDIDQNFIETKASASDAEFTTPANCYFINLSTSTEYGGTYKGDICINLAWSGTYNGDYEPYDEHTYALSNIDLRGVIKKGASGNLYYDGDIYKSDGTITRKYGIVDLNSLAWQKIGISAGAYYFLAPVSDLKNATTRTLPLITGRYPAYSSGGSFSDVPDKAIYNTYAASVYGVGIVDYGYETASALKTSLSGVYMVYELAVPTEETADPYAFSMIVNDWGTEEFVDGRTVEMPVGHFTKYPANLRDKLQHLPNLASTGDGEYTIQQTGQTMSLKKFDQSMKANIDGLYEDMTVGNAEQLVATTFETDKIPYNFRTSGGSLEIGDREEDELNGGSVAWNQLCDSSDVVTSFAGVSLVISNGKYTISGTATGTGGRLKNWSNSLVPCVDGHKGIVISNIDFSNLSPYATKSGDSSTYFTWSPNRVFSMNFTGDGIFGANIVNGEAYNTSGYLNIFDLTLMFGSAIADYIYTLEQSNAGAGVAYFRKLFPKPYYAYDAGGLKSVKTSAHRMTGFNQWDEEWELGALDASTGAPVTSPYTIRSKNFCQCIGGASYYMTCGKTDGGVNNRYYLGIFWYDFNEALVERVFYNNGVVTAPENARYFKICTNSSTVVYGTTYNHDICVNLHWDGERDGEYEPYRLTEYALDSDLELRGVFKLDANNSLYCDGDVYQSDGTVKRWLKEIVFDGSPDEIIETDGSGRVFVNLPSDSITWTDGNAVSRKTLCDRFVETTNSITYNGGMGYHYRANETHALTFSLGADSGVATVEQWQAWFAAHPTTVLYALAEPIEETALPYQNPQIVDDFGTEEYVDERDVAIPVGHSTEYMPNLRAKVETAPDSPDSNGDYILRRANGANTYVPLVIPTELPQAPSSDGTYTLSVTISDGTATYSWVST